MAGNPFSQFLIPFIVSCVLLAVGTKMTVQHRTNRAYRLVACLGLALVVGVCLLVAASLNGSEILFRSALIIGIAVGVAAELVLHRLLPAGYSCKQQNPCG